ncbi:uncharacterized protein LOC141897631 [Acropora palmata]|uniref:uncharacterized protein LOC141897631 n=1 Tax=Acropora palmata TaxID=6131 RepID=UPI003DA1BFDD
MEWTFLLLICITLGTAVYASHHDVCHVQVNDRTDCGWFGINNETCQDRGCCYDDTYPDTIYCFYPTSNKCYGIDPSNRVDCGYFGIQREECENDRGCCFDHTVYGVAWCFEGRPEEPEFMEGSAAADGV